MGITVHKALQSHISRQTAQTTKNYQQARKRPTQGRTDPTPENVKGVGQLTQPRCYVLIFSLSPGIFWGLFWGLFLRCFGLKNVL